MMMMMMVIVIMMMMFIGCWWVTEWATCKVASHIRPPWTFFATWWGGWEVGGGPRVQINLQKFRKIFWKKYKKTKNTGSIKHISKYMYPGVVFQYFCDSDIFRNICNFWKMKSEILKKIYLLTKIFTAHLVCKILKFSQFSTPPGRTPRCLGVPPCENFKILH